MIVDPKSIEAFHSIRRTNYEWVKDVEKDELLDEVLAWDHTGFFRFKLDPYAHQAQGLFLCWHIPQFLIFAGMATGKTKIVLDMLQLRLMTEDDAQAGLVLVPRDVNVDGWMELIAEHSDLEAIGLVGSTQDKWELFEKRADLYVVSYPGFNHMVCKKGETKSGKGRLVKNATLLKRVHRRIGTLILDESHRAGNRTSLTHRVLATLGNNIDHRYALTGTPFGRDPLRLFGEFLLIDKGSTFGTSAGVFQKAFYVSERGWGWGGRKYTFDKTKKKSLARMARNRSSRWRTKDCVDLPQIVMQEIHFELPKQARKLHDVAKHEFRRAGRERREKGTLVRKNSMMTMRQICSGFVNRGGKGERDYQRLLENPKLEALVGILEGLEEEEKILVLYFFQESGDILSDELKANKFKFTHLKGGMSGRRQIEAVKRFKTNRSVTVLLAQVNCVAEGGNLQVAQYAVYYELPIGSIDKRQCDMRIPRPGSEYENVFIMTLLGKNSVEERHRDLLEEGKSLMDMVMDK